MAVHSPEEKHTGKTKTPVEITVLSTDVALFSDTTTTVHVASFEAFWNYVAGHFHDSGVSRMRLVVAKTNALASKSENEKEGGESNTYSTAISECIHAIQAKLDELELSTNAPADFTFSVIENSRLGYQALSRELIRETLPARDTGCRISFDLPEIADGTQCCVSFDATYQTFPYPVGSKEAATLREELRLLSHQKLKVLQLVPLSSIDAGLLYSVPYSLRAGLEDSIAQFQEMEVLARVLFQLLQDRELALLLCATQKQTQQCSDSAFQNNQMFVLMTKEFPMKQPPQSGLLFRYAHADQLFTEAVPGNPCPALEDEIGSQYSQYVEQALGTLDCDPFNPLDAVPPIVSTRKRSLLPFAENIEHSKDQSMVTDADPTCDGAPPESYITEKNLDATSFSLDLSTNTSYDDDRDNRWNDSAGVGSRQTQPEPDMMQEDDSAAGFFHSRLPEPQGMDEDSIEAEVDVYPTVEYH